MKAEEAVVVISAIYGEADVKHDLIYLKIPGRPIFDPQVFINPLDNPIDHFGDPTLDKYKSRTRSFKRF